MKKNYDFDRETLSDNIILKKEIEALKRYNRRWKAVNITVMIALFLMIWELIFLVM
jgi:hypothetical protein